MDAWLRETRVSPRPPGRGPATTPGCLRSGAAAPGGRGRAARAPRRLRGAPRLGRPRHSSAKTSDRRADGAEAEEHELPVGNQLGNHLDEINGRENTMKGNSENSAQKPKNFWRGKSPSFLFSAAEEVRVGPSRPWGPLRDDGSVPSLGDVHDSPGGDRQGDAHGSLQCRSAEACAASAGRP